MAHPAAASEAQRRLIARLKHAVDSAQNELENVQSDNAWLEGFTPGDEEEAQRLREWSVPYPRHLVRELTACPYCKQPYQMSNGPAIKVQTDIIHEAKKPVNKAQDEVKRLEDRLCSARKIEEEDLETPLAKRVKHKRDFEYRSKERDRIPEYEAALPPAREALAAATTAAAPALKAAREEIHRLRRQEEMYRQRHWPVQGWLNDKTAVGNGTAQQQEAVKQDPEEQREQQEQDPEEQREQQEQDPEEQEQEQGKQEEKPRMLCMDCACDPDVSEDFRVYSKATYKVPSWVKDAWFK